MESNHPQCAMVPLPAIGERSTQTSVAVMMEVPLHDPSTECRIRLELVASITPPMQVEEETTASPEAAEKAQEARSIAFKVVSLQLSLSLIRGSPPESLTLSCLVSLVLFSCLVSLVL